MWKWVYFNSSTIQAVCAFLGVLGLVWYAIETSMIRRTTLAQSEASRRPFFILETLRLISAPSGLNSEDPVSIKNTGVGIALAVRWDFLDCGDSKMPTATGAIAPGASLRLTPRQGGTELTFDDIRKRGLLVRYTDTAKKSYWSRMTVVDGGYVRIDTGEA